MMSGDTAERHENPHRPAERPPLLTPHPFRPGTFGAGVALTALGAVFLLQQLGDLSLGPLTTVAVVTLAAAVLLIAVAVGWSRRARDAGEDPVSRR
jgi:hypothetical protein